MENVIDLIKQPWPWYIAGPLIGFCVPALLLAGNKTLGISSTLRQICAMCLPANISFLKYNWKDQLWNLYFAAGLIIGGFIGGVLLYNDALPKLAESTIRDLQAMGIALQENVLPAEIFSWSTFSIWPNVFIVIGGGFLVGFGTRWAGGCTSGHGIYGLSALQWPSLIAVITFFASGILTANYLLPFLLK
ncbi:MAG: YeeE/YedE family protein [Chitinophagales bacterium]|nr:YeeE/YedE family protein [Chitinophagales bacterium]